jgi:biopolymer transport protein ExbD
MASKRFVNTAMEVELPITPMLDFAFQVLLFCIMNFHPSQFTEGQMDLNLPDAAQAKAAKPEDVRPSASTPGNLELPSEVTVIVKTGHDGRHDGQITDISVQDTAGTTPVGGEQAGTVEAKLKALLLYLGKARSGLSNQDDIKIQAETGLKYEGVMQVMDACTKAKFKNVSFGPPPDLSAGQ